MPTYWDVTLHRIDLAYMPLYNQSTWFKYKSQLTMLSQGKSHCKTCLTMCSTVTVLIHWALKIPEFFSVPFLYCQIGANQWQNSSQPLDVLPTLYLQPWVVTRELGLCFSSPAGVAIQVKNPRCIPTAALDVLSCMLQSASAQSKTHWVCNY